MALDKLSDEDPTFRIKCNPETGQTIISGMGELQLEVLVDRMKREFNVEATTGAPRLLIKKQLKRLPKEKVNISGKPEVVDNMDTVCSGLNQ